MFLLRSQRLSSIKPNVHYDICGHGHSSTENLNTFVIGRVIEDEEELKDLTTVQVKLSLPYYEYDGTLTTESFLPLRWVVGRQPVHFNIEQLTPIAKPARPLQNLDGRIVLYSRD